VFVVGALWMPQTIVNHSVPGPNYDTRLHIFGQISGVLAPYEYRTINANFELDFLLQLFDHNAKVIDENLNRDRPCFDAEHALELLEKVFVLFNVPFPDTTSARVCDSPPASSAYEISCSAAAQLH
jgi:hypothetical protein